MSAPTTSAAFIAFIGGVFYTLWGSGMLGRLLACGFDWTVFWTAVQAVAVIVAALIAISQLGSYLSTERDKNTIALFQELDIGETDKFIHKLNEYGDIQQNVDEIVAALNKFDKANREALTTSLRALANLFERIALQYEARAINRDMYLSRMDEITLNFYFILKELQRDAKFPWDFSAEVKALIDDCKRTYALDKQNPRLLNLTL
jgi:hypothetical protein